MLINSENHGFKTIPVKIKPTSVPQIVTTTKTLRRFCGFSVAAACGLFYCLRIIFAFIWLGCNNFKANEEDSKLLAIEFLAGLIGIILFFRLMKYPQITLKESNFEVKMNKPRY